MRLNIKSEEISLFMTKLNAALHRSRSERYEALISSSPGLDEIEFKNEFLNSIFYTLTQGSKYIKVIRGDEHNRCAEIFICRQTGDLYEAESWSQPRKKSYGNIRNT